MKFFKAMAYMTKKIFQVPEKNYGLNHIGSVHPGLSPPWPQSSGFNPPWPQSPWPQSPWPQSTWPQSPWNHIFSSQFPTNFTSKTFLQR